jgi:rhamnulokinase
MHTTPSTTYAAVDLGAGSGRVILGRFDGQSLALDEAHRFPNGGVALGGSLFWDFLALWKEILSGLCRAQERAGGALKSLALDTWGVDFGLLDADDRLVGNPYHYRDRRTDGMIQAASQRVPREEIFAQTGVQFMQLNSLYQLLAMVLHTDPGLQIAHTFLNIPDLFNFFLCGEKASEFTIATTTQCYDIRRKSWAYELLNALGIPTGIFCQVIEPGSVLGRLSAAICEESGLPSLKVIAGAGHDTACAVAAIPASGQEFIYISSGTWSLVGVERDSPLVSAESLAAGITNEGGVSGKTRFLKNVMGMWLVQECRRRWARQGKEYSYDELTRLAAAAPAFGPLMMPSDPRFLAPGDMPAEIQAYCHETGQRAPEDRGALLRCILESLALEYRRVIEQLDHLDGVVHPVIHIVGGGSQNALLNQFTADAAARPVFAGPVEATAMGNLLVQAIAQGDIASLEEGRAIVRRSSHVKTYLPRDSSAWDEAYRRYLDLNEKAEE